MYCIYRGYSWLHLISIYILLSIYLWLLWVLVALPGLSLVVVGGGCSLVAVCRLLIGVAS